MSRMVGPSRLLRRVFFEPLLSATKDSSMVLTIYSYTEEQREAADERTLSLWCKVGHLYSPHVRPLLDRQSYHHSALVISTLVGGSPLHSGLSALMCWWRAYRCQSLPGHVRQTSKDSSVSLPLDSIWNCVCMCVTVFKYWEATFIVWVIVWVKLSCT